MTIRNDIRIEEAKKRPSSVQPKKEEEPIYKPYNVDRVNNARNQLNNYYSHKKKVNENEDRVRDILNKYKKEDNTKKIPIDPILMSMDKNIDFHELDQFSPPNNVNNIIEFTNNINKEQQQYNYNYDKPKYEPMYKKEKINERPASAKARTIDYEKNLTDRTERKVDIASYREYKPNTPERTKEDIIRDYERNKMIRDQDRKNIEMRVPTPDRRTQPRQMNDNNFEYKTISRDRTPDRQYSHKEVTPSRVNDQVYKYQSERKNDGLNFDYSKRDSGRNNPMNNNYSNQYKLDTTSKSYILEKLGKILPNNNNNNFNKVKFI